MCDSASVAQTPTLWPTPYFPLAFRAALQASHADSRRHSRRPRRKSSGRHPSRHPSPIATDRRLIQLPPCLGASTVWNPHPGARPTSLLHRKNTTLMRAIGIKIVMGRTRRSLDGDGDSPNKRNNTPDKTIVVIDGEVSFSTSGSTNTQSNSQICKVCHQNTGSKCLRCSTCSGRVHFTCWELLHYIHGDCLSDEEDRNQD